MRFLPIWTLFLISTHSWAFPEMIRHGYVNCISCHVSPTGGGVLTEYGREISGNLLSTWGADNPKEAQFAYDIVKLPDWLTAIGNYRGVYAYQNTPYISQGQYIYMQGDAEAAAHLKKWYFDASLGYENKPNDISFTDHLISATHFINYRPTDEFSFRIGRFYPAFGIYTPDHVIPTKRDLGWDEGQQTYNLEAAYISEKWNVFLTPDFGRPDQPSLHRETGFSAWGSLAFADTYKVGLTYFYGNGQSTTRNVAGIWGTLGFAHNLFLLSEWDLQQQGSKNSSFPSQLGGVDYNRFDYELIQGLHVYLTQDFSQLNFNDFQTLHNSFGLGVQWFPRPHFEINVSWQRLRTIAISSDYTDFAWAMINIYI